MTTPGHTTQTTIAHRITLTTGEQFDITGMGRSKPQFRVLGLYAEVVDGVLTRVSGSGKRIRPVSGDLDPVGGTFSFHDGHEGRESALAILATRGITVTGGAE